MMRWLKQMCCVHWFDPSITREDEYHAGHIICNQQKLFRQLVEIRICSRCDLIDSRRIGDPECLGWE